MILTIYSTVTPLLYRAVSIASFFHPKLRTFFTVRQGTLDALEKKINALPKPVFRIWIHAASVGEFEQARPIVSAMKKAQPDIDVVVSFLSTSGYQTRKNYPDASAVFYLPIDTKSNARRLIEILKPDALLVMRYDFWPNHLIAAKKHGTALILAAAVLQKNSPYFKPLVKTFYHSVFALFDKIYTSSSRDTESFREVFRCKNTETAGDPRFDQVLLRSRNTQRVAHLSPLFAHHTVLVAGSVWKQDELVLLPAWQELKHRPSLIMVPHETDHDNLERLSRHLTQCNISFSKVSEGIEHFDAINQVLIIDETGYLAELYSIASIAYVGGGFGINVHNTIEPAAYGIPVLFGSRHHNSPEAENLVECGGAAVVHNSAELREKLAFLTANKENRMRMGELAGTFVTSRIGATKKIADYILEQKRTRNDR
ncbi:3-deoxy-D-manno-octulosonic acid transferase [Chlorobium phaeobacteroides]|uniref:3-deoxy-D-manno-octulosonic acid transferase n=1 Tax=Chlorobium phaeobacteroides (strain DSM 266 / SMG 266 / 2430) TaxID=290317 RepID=A1BHB8_CHLPD|nr:glycosyltransferase N-terminal domain-containing protein [Chlorobium phaeobacteroides]ABL65795.1 Three-deoxy-D-manno-octulosonic-acid transferase domain protein [Chlorobium phaeobacteroides DSM 266]